MQVTFAQLTFDPSLMIDANGIGIAITGMSIVFVALIVISLFIAALPRVLNLLDPYLPKASHIHAPSSPKQTAAPSPLENDESTVAAIGFALHQHRK